MGSLEIKESIACGRLGAPVQGRIAVGDCQVWLQALSQARVVRFLELSESKPA